MITATTLNSQISNDSSNVANTTLEQEKLSDKLQ